MAKYTKRSDGRYSTSVQIGRDSKTGKIIRKIIYGKTINELNQNVLNFKIELGKNTYSSSTVSFLTFANKWLAVKKPSIKINTYEMYERAIRLHCEPIHDTELKNITKLDLNKLINNLADKPNSAKKLRLTLKQIFSTATENDIIKKDIALNLAPIKYRQKESRALTQDEIKTIQSVTLSPRERAYIDNLFYLGLRKGENLALNISDVDFKHNIVSISHSLVNDEISTTKTQKGVRVIPIPFEYQEPLKSYCESLESEWLFTLMDRKTLITESSFRKMWSSILKKIDNYVEINNSKAVKENRNEDIITFSNDLHSHLFRHNYATLAHANGVPLKTAQKLLGHSDIQTTANIYTHLDNEREALSAGVNSMFDNKND